MMENRTFDHMFGRFPRVNGYIEAQAPNPTFDYEHNGPSVLAALDGGKMDEFPARPSMCRGWRLSITTGSTCATRPRALSHSNR
jgi:Phosphoesterase family